MCIRDRNCTIRETPSLQVIADNVSLHNVKNVRDFFQEVGIKQCMLAPRSSKWHQIMDLLVYRPLKCCIRRARHRKVYDAFQLYRDELFEAASERKNIPDFVPPPLEMHECISASDLRIIDTSKFGATIRTSGPNVTVVT